MFAVSPSALFSRLGTSRLALASLAALAPRRVATLGADERHGVFASLVCEVCNKRRSARHRHLLMGKVYRVALLSAEPLALAAIAGWQVSGAGFFLRRVCYNFCFSGFPLRLRLHLLGSFVTLCRFRSPPIWSVLTYPTFAFRYCHSWRVCLDSALRLVVSVLLVTFWSVAPFSGLSSGAVALVVGRGTCLSPFRFICLSKNCHHNVKKEGVCHLFSSLFLLL